MKMHQELISIVAPAYNHAVYILDALNSVKNQEYQNKELIIIDDCSTDNTVSEIEKFLSDSRLNSCFPGGIQFIKHKKNMNAHRSLNEGIGLAKGEYVAIINTDDMYEHKRIGLMLDQMLRHGGRFAFSDVRTINEKNQENNYKVFENMIEKIYCYPRISMVLAVENVSISTGNYIFEKKLYQEVGGFNEEYHFIHDWDFILRCCLFCEPIFVKDTNYLYRFHDTNTMKQIVESEEMMRKKEQEVYAVLYNYLDHLKKKNYKNKDIPSEEVWDYYFNNKQLCYASSIWNALRQN